LNLGKMVMLKILKNIMALFIWWLCYIPLNIFILTVFIRQIMEGKADTGSSTNLENDDQRIIALVEKNLESYRDVNSNEGFGTQYERLMVNDLLLKTCVKYGLRSILESPADGITGVPGANSLCLAGMAEKPVALSNPSALLLERAGDTWKQMGLADKMEACQCPVAKLIYPDRSYELVWSFCMIEQMKDPESYLRELFRVSAKTVLMITVNDNSGVWLHRQWHRFGNIPWNHGNEALMNPAGIKAAFRRAGLKVVEAGGVDVPPTLDTSDMSLTADLRRIAGLFGRKWDWNLKGEKQRPGAILHLFSWLEHNLPRWFKIRHAHHIYVVGMRNDGSVK
jgi:hypothetical protein